jgi:uncharacterized LabA/DUF88 family protein
MTTTDDGALTASGAPGHGAPTPTQPTNKPTTRRRRAPSRRRTEGESSVAPAPTDVATEPAAESVEQATSPVDAQPAAGAQDEHSQAPQTSARPRRARNARGRRPAVELVRPPSEGEADGATEREASGSADETASAPAREAHTAPAEVASADEETATSSPTRRYRFERPARRATPTSAAPTVRPERLSGRLAPSAQPEDRLQTTAAPETPASAPEAGVEHEESLESLLAGLGQGATGETTLLDHPEEAPDASARADGPAEPPLLEPDIEPLAEEAESAEGSESHEETPATRRRRRRRRTGTHGAEGEESAEQPATRTGGLSVVDFGAPTTPAVDRRQGGVEPPPAEPPYAPFTAPYTPGMRSRSARPAQPPAWSLGEPSSQEIGQPDSPFVSPDPVYPRGFGPQPRGVAGPVRETYTPRTGRTERGAETPISTNQLANLVSGAIQQQTDRLLTELRRQAPPASMTVSMPPFPSTERVGVFVDVANIVYSSRNLRVQVEFGRLLDFLRGNRRLIRAHAYAPTSPEPQADQAFLSVVKGVGYRITTKNYKTFSSGAKKADLDLDMCMDIVRLVDSGAVETVVLVSGDSDFLPLLEYCSDKGVRVEVAAFDDSAAAILRQSCDLFINLSLVDDILV